MQARSPKKPSTTKRMIWMLIPVGLLLLVLVGWNVGGTMMMKEAMSKMTVPPQTVSTTKAAFQQWQPSKSAVGTLRAARGADLAFEVAGLVTKVNLRSGGEVKEGDVLVQLFDADEQAQLQQYQASAALAEVTFGRAKQQLTMQAISKADYDVAAADLKGKQAAVAQQRAVIAKKQLRAPFSGRAGIVTLNPGAYISAGTAIVTLQQLDPIYVDFFVPQRTLGELKVGQKTQLTLDAFAGKTFEGKLTAINPKVDGDTRNVQIEASVPNHDRVLTPGMFANVSVEVGDKERHLTLPQTAIVYNPYGATVYLVKTRAEFDKAQAAAAALNDDKKTTDTKPADAKPADKGKPDPAKSPPADDLVAQQAFVTTGATRGDQVAIVKGIDEGVEVVSSGQLKLKSGSGIKIDNSVQPSNNPNPTPQEH